MNRPDEITLQNLMDWNYDFAKRVFPMHCNDPVAPMCHLKDEVDETIVELAAGDMNKEIALEEYADCLILLTGSARRINITANQLLEAAFSKMEINEGRDWGEPDENGVYKHKK